MSATGVPVCTPHTGRLSTITEARMSAFSWVGSDIQLCATCCQDATERTNGAAPALTPFSSMRRPQRPQARR